MLITRGVKTLIALAGVSLFAMAGTAQAVTTLSFGDAYYLGRVTPGAPAGQSDEEGYINYLLTMAVTDAPEECASNPVNFCDRNGSQLLDVSGLPAADWYDKNESGANSLTINSGSVKYILGKYDANNAGSYIWYNSAGFTGSIVLPGKDPAGGNYGISHFSLFNTGDGDLDYDAPEPGTLALLGLGLIGLGLARRRQAA